MLKITPDPPQDGTFVSAPINDLLQDRAAVGRALKHYLRDVPPPPANIETEEAWSMRSACCVAPASRRLRQAATSMRRSATLCYRYSIWWTWPKPRSKKH